jgi:hypothetical protein
MNADAGSRQTVAGNAIAVSSPYVRRSRIWVLRTTAGQEMRGDAVRVAVADPGYDGAMTAAAAALREGS